MNLDTIAIRGFEDPDVIISFIEQYIDHDKIFKSSFENKLSDFYEAMHWGRVPENNNLSKFFTF
jgi:hypothetical protein